MISVVIPARNEAERISKTLDNCMDLNVDLIIPVLNGCSDETKKHIEGHVLNNIIHIIEFPQALGVDIPRAIGAAYAYKKKSQTILFLDGDMAGNISSQLEMLLNAVKQEDTDMALTNCYPFIYYRPLLADLVLSFREKLNRNLEIFSEIGLATPSHGPHAISRRLLDILPWHALAVPPLSMAIAVKNNLNVKVCTSIEHHLLLSPLKDNNHGTKIAETIIGDSLMALKYFEETPLSRKDSNIIYSGYHPKRRFDILNYYVKSLTLT